MSRFVYRAMREDPAGGPMIGPTARTLGVRPSAPPGGDIPVISRQVQPNTGGMSVAPDDPMNLPPIRRPKSLGGSGKDPVWYIDMDLLGADLAFIQDKPTHGVIGPSRAMRLDDFEKALAATRASWKKT
jgi:hypothetical protein